MPSKSKTRDDFGGAWKEAIETYLREFLDFFFPASSAGIDWPRGYRFLDKELQKLTPHGALRKGVVDKLFEAYALDGTSRLLAIHLEAQNQRIHDLPERVYQYNYRIYDRLRRPVASLILLTDANASWRPNQFECETRGCIVTLTFPIAKLLDFDTPEYAAHANPFSFIVRAHRRAQVTQRDMRQRYDLRMALTEELAALVQNDQAQATRFEGVLKFFEWVMQMPAELEDEFMDEYNARHKEDVMFVPYRERKAEARGLTQGRAESLLIFLTARFGQLPDTLREAIARIQDSDTLDRLLALAATCSARDEFERALGET
ncbi:MAG: cytosolic protein [Acidobacteria bacterium]|nr:cytosolic protein [Acidobacteriota bacterium]